jgi:hypothetical protein
VPKVALPEQQEPPVRSVQQGPQPPALGPVQQESVQQVHPTVALALPALGRPVQPEPSRSSFPEQ